ncbi:MAG: hypothetical protein ABJG42_24235 [Vibrio splendidus]
MHRADILYGSVLTTGEIAYYMSLSKSQKANDVKKAEFLKHWLGKRIKSKRDDSSLRKYLKILRQSKRLVRDWRNALRVYHGHIEGIERNDGKTDRSLLYEALAELHDEGFCVKLDIDEFSYSPDEVDSTSSVGTVALLVNQEAAFTSEGYIDPDPIKLIVLGSYARRRAFQILGLKSFPLLRSNRNEIIAIGSAQDHIAEVKQLLNI